MAALPSLHASTKASHVRYCYLCAMYKKKILFILAKGKFHPVIDIVL